MKAPSVLVTGIDPGPEKSAILLVEFGGSDEVGRIRDSAWVDNELVTARMWGPMALLYEESSVAIEWVVHYGKMASPGKDTFDTCFWVGRFFDQVITKLGEAPHLYEKPEINAHIVGIRNADKPIVRRALVDRWGGKGAAVGAKKCQYCKGKRWRGRNHDPCEECDATGWEREPGPLVDVRGHAWDALAVAVMHYEKTYGISLAAAG